MCGTKRTASLTHTFSVCQRCRLPFNVIHAIFSGTFLEPEMDYLESIAKTRLSTCIMWASQLLPSRVGCHRAGYNSDYLFDDAGKVDLVSEKDNMRTPEYGRPGAHRIYEMSKREVDDRDQSRLPIRATRSSRCSLTKGGSVR